MSVEALVLALMSALRPTGLGAVSALLGGPRPTRVLAAYVAAGLGASIVSGIVVVTALHGIRVETGASTVNAILEIAGGAAALGFAGAISTGHFEIGTRGEGVRHQSSLARRLRDPSLRVAAGAGVATHLPGLFYLLGLNAIASGDPGFIGGIVDVLIFDVLWLALPLIALALSVRRPETFRDAITRASAWAHAHERTLLTLAFLLVGAYFTARGIYDLLR